MWGWVRTQNAVLSGVLLRWYFCRPGHMSISQAVSIPELSCVWNCRKNQATELHEFSTDSHYLTTDRVHLHGKSFSWKKVVSLITILQVSNLMLISLNLTRSPPILSGLRLSIMNSFNISLSYLNFLCPPLHLKFFLAIFKIILIFQGPTQVISLISVLLNYLMSFMLFYKVFYILLEQERIQSTNQLPWCLSFFNFVFFSSFYLFDSLLYHSFTKLLNPLRAGRCFFTSVLAVTVHCK